MENREGTAKGVDIAEEETSHPHEPNNLAEMTVQTGVPKLILNSDSEPAKKGADARGGGVLSSPRHVGISYSFPCSEQLTLLVKSVSVLEDSFPLAPRARMFHFRVPRFSSCFFTKPTASTGDKICVTNMDDAFGVKKAFLAVQKRDVQRLPIASHALSGLDFPFWVVCHAQACRADGWEHPGYCDWSSRRNAFAMCCLAQ